jgi:hypothetical protein
VNIQMSQMNSIFADTITPSPAECYFFPFINIEE